MRSSRCGLRGPAQSVPYRVRDGGRWGWCGVGGFRTLAGEWALRPAPRFRSARLRRGPRRVEEVRTLRRPRPSLPVITTFFPYRLLRRCRSQCRGHEDARKYIKRPLCLFASLRETHSPFETANRMDLHLLRLGFLGSGEINLVAFAGTWRVCRGERVQGRWQTPRDLLLRPEANQAGEDEDHPPVGRLERRVSFTQRREDAKVSSCILASSCPRHCDNDGEDGTRKKGA